MPADRWKTFQQVVRREILWYSDEMYTVAVGDGQYEGSSEETAIFVASDPSNANGIRCLSDNLSKIAGEFGQDSIALLQGAPTFIGPTP
jgi:hypothetical protein